MKAIVWIVDLLCNIVILLFTAILVVFLWILHTATRPVTYDICCRIVLLHTLYKRLEDDTVSFRLVADACYHFDNEKLKHLVDLVLRNKLYDLDEPLIRELLINLTLAKLKSK